MILEAKTFPPPLCLLTFGHKLLLSKNFKMTKTGLCTLLFKRKTPTFNSHVNFVIDIYQ